jgi:nucleoside-diphosphate-sugar epimerase
MIGSVIEAELKTTGHEVVGYDRLDGLDILDASSVEKTIRGCEAVVHLASPLGDPGDSPHETMRAIVQGTWNVLLAAEQALVRRVVYMSSVDALGVFQGERKPDYLPLDDNHPCYPATPYAIGKYLAEQMCRYWCARTGISTLCLRPPGVWTPETYHEIQKLRRERPSYEWDPYWEYGAFIDVRDLASASLRGLSCSLAGFACVLVASSDITTSGKTSKELVDFVHPDVEWRGGSEYQTEPYRSLLITDKAEKLLGWKPIHTWQAFIAANRHA